MGFSPHLHIHFITLLHVKKNSSDHKWTELNLKKFLYCFFWCYSELDLRHHHQVYERYCLYHILWERCNLNLWPQKSKQFILECILFEALLRYCVHDKETCNLKTTCSAKTIYNIFCKVVCDIVLYLLYLPLQSQPVTAMVRWRCFPELSGKNWNSSIAPTHLFIL